MIPTIQHFGKGKTMEIVKKINGCQGLRVEHGDQQAEHRFLGGKILFMIP